MYRHYRDRVAFVVVYIREAHPEDGWQMPANVRDEVVFNTPTTFDERTHIATSCQAGLDLSIPMIVDGMDNAVEEAYAGWPDRLYVVSVDGKIAYKGGPGPGGFDPGEMQATLDEILAAGDLPHRLRVVPAEFPGKPSTSVEVQHPWDAGGASNLMLPENLYSDQETIFTGQNWVEVEAKYPQDDQPEWREIVPARLLRYEHKLGEEYILRARAEVKDGGVDVELSVENLTDEPLSDLRAQVCFGSQRVEDFASKDLARVRVPLDGTMTALTDVPKVGSWDGLKRYMPVSGTGLSADLTAADMPFIGLVNGAETRSMGATWQGAKYVITNGELTCIHADPGFPDCQPKETVTAKGRLFFVEGNAQKLLEEVKDDVKELQEATE